MFKGFRKGLSLVLAFSMMASSAPVTSLAESLESSPEVYGQEEAMLPAAGLADAGMENAEDLSASGFDQDMLDQTGGEEDAANEQGSMERWAYPDSDETWLEEEASQSGEWEAWEEDMLDEAEVYAENAENGVDSDAYGASGLMQDGAVDAEQLIEDPDLLAEEASKKTELTEEGQTGEASIRNLPDSNELFAAYVNRLFYGTAAGDADDYYSEEISEDVIDLASGGAYAQLDANSETVFDCLRDAVTSIAAGDQTSTVVEIPLTAFGLTKDTRYTAADLGIQSLLSDNGISPEAMSAMSSKLSFDQNLVTDMLLAECPYELYWFDKTKAMSIQFSSVSYAGMGDEEWLFFSNENAVVLSMPVNREYAGTEAYTVNTSMTGAAVTAAENAQAVVTGVAGEGDLEKLTSYKNYINGQVSYNSEAAADENMPYGNPWQLIWVFDENPSTNVVCEGYSKAFKYLFDASSFADSTLDCLLVTGTMSGGTGAGPHMWNLVCAGGSSYLADITNSDEGSVGQNGELFLTGADDILANGYSVHSVNYVYDSDTLSLYQPEVLALSSISYQEALAQQAQEPEEQESGSEKVTESEPATEGNTEGNTGTDPEEDETDPEDPSDPEADNDEDLSAGAIALDVRGGTYSLELEKNETAKYSVHITEETAGRYTMYSSGNTNSNLFVQLYRQESDGAWSLMASDYYGRGRNNHFMLTYNFTAGDYVFKVANSWADAVSGTSVTFLPTSISGGNLLDDVVYPVYLDQGKMVQANGTYYYYSFTPAQAGSYTFYTDGNPSSFNIEILHDDLSGYTRVADSYENRFFYSSFPASYTVELAAEETCYIKVSAYSNNDSYVNLHVRGYQKQVLAIADVQADRTSMEPGDTLTVRVKTGDNVIRKAGLALTLSGSSLSYFSFTEMDPGKEDGYTAFVFDCISREGTYCIQDVQNICILDEYGVPYELSWPEEQVSALQVQVSSLQSALDALAQAGGGELRLYDCDVVSDLVIPETVTLKIAGYLNVHASLSVNGTLVISRTENTYGYSNASMHVYSSGTVKKAEGGIIQTEGGSVTVNHSSEDLAADHLRSDDVEGVFGACYYDSGNGDTKTLQWRHGKWRTLRQGNELPDEDEIKDVSGETFSFLYNSPEPYSDEAWFRYTVPAGMERARLSLSSSPSDGVMNCYVRTAESSETVYTHYWYNDSSSRNDSLQLKPGTTYYFCFSLTGKERSVNVSAQLDTDFVTAQDFADALDFENASITVTDGNTGIFKNVQIDIPVKERDLLSKVTSGYIYYNKMGGNMQGGNMMVSVYGSLSGNTYRMTGSFIAVDFTADTIRASLSQMYFYTGNESFTLYPDNAQVTWQEANLHMGITDFGPLSAFETESIQLEPEDIEVGEEKEVTYLGNDRYHVYRFAAKEVGEYTFYLSNNQIGYSSYVINNVPNVYSSFNIYGRACTQTLSEGDTMYFLLSRTTSPSSGGSSGGDEEEGNAETSDQKLMFGVTADTGTVHVLSASFGDAQTAVTGLTKVNLHVETQEDVRAVTYSLKPKGNNTTGYYGNMMLANTDAVLSLPEGGYELNYLTVYDAYGKAHTYNQNDLPEVDFASCLMTVTSLSNWLRAQLENGVTEVKMDNLSISKNGISKSVVVPQGLTLTVSTLNLNNGGELQVDGTLRVTGYTYLGTYMGTTADKEKLTVFGRFESAYTWVYSDSPESYADRISGIKNGDSLSGSGSTTRFRWNDGAWVKQRNDGFPEYDEMTPAQLGTYTKGKTIYDEDDEGAVWFSYVPGESGIFRATTLTGYETVYCYVYNPEQDNYSRIDYSCDLLVLLRAGDRICFRIWDEEEDGDDLLLEIATSGLTAENIADKISFAGLKSDVAVHGSTADVTVTIPVNNWNLEEEIRSAEIELTSFDDDGDEMDDFYMSGQYDSETKLLKMQRTISLTRQEEALSYDLSTLTVATGTEDGTEHEWRIRIGEEETEGSSSVRSCYKNLTPVPTITLPWSGRIALSVSDWTEVPVNTSTYFSFRPSADGEYYLETKEKVDYLDTDEFEDAQTYSWAGHNLTAGVTYHSYVYPEFYEDDEETAQARPTVVHVRIARDETKISLTGVSLDETTFLQGQSASGRLNLNVQGGQVSSASLYFESDAGDSVYLYGSMDEEGEDGDDGVIAVKGTVETYVQAGLFSLSEISVTDRYGKYFTFPKEELDQMGIQASLEVGSVLDAIHGANSGETIRLNTLELSGDTALEIPAGVTVTVKNMYLYGTAVLTVNGTLQANSYCYVSGSCRMVLNRDIFVSGRYIEYDGQQVSGSGLVVLDGEAEDYNYYVSSPEKTAHLRGSVLNTRLRVRTEEGNQATVIHYWDGSTWSEEEAQSGPEGQAVLTATLTGAQSLEDGSGFTAVYGTTPWITAVLHYDNGEEVQAKKAVFASDNTQVAEVAEDGKIILKTSGTANLTVTLPGSDETENLDPPTFRLTVLKAKQRISYTRTEWIKYLIEKSFALGASAKTELVYAVSDPKVVSVDESGKVTLLNVGSAVITINATGDGCYEEAEPVQVNVTVLAGDSEVKLKKKAWALGYDSVYGEAGDATLQLPGEGDRELLSVIGGALQVEGSDESNVLVYDPESKKLTGKASGKTTLTVYAAADEEMGYSASDRKQVPVEVLDPDALFDGKTYISVSSALSAMKETNQGQGLITLLRNTENSSVLHLPSDRAVIEKEMDVILNLAGKQYNGALRILGRLTLRNTTEAVDGSSGKRRMMAGPGSQEEEGAAYSLGAGGELVVEQEAVEKVAGSISGDVAKVVSDGRQTGGSQGGTDQTQITTFYADVAGAIEAANELAAENVQGSGDEKPAVTVELTNPAILEKSVELSENVTLNLAGNPIAAATNETISGNGTVESKGADNQEAAVTLAKGILQGAEEGAGVGLKIDSAAVTEIDPLRIPSFAVSQQEPHVYDGKSPELELKPEGNSDPGTFVIEPVPGAVDAGTHTYTADVYLKGEGNARTFVKRYSGEITIQPRPVEVSVTGVDKTYDGQTKATVSTMVSADPDNEINIQELLAADDVDIVTTAWFDSDDAGEQKEVSGRILLEKDGDPAGNFVLENSEGQASTMAEFTTRAAIKPAKLQGVKAEDRTDTYSGSMQTPNITVPSGAVIRFAELTDEAYRKLDLSQNSDVNEQIENAVNGQWEAEQPAFTNAGTYYTAYEVTRKNYETEYGVVKNEITKKQVQVTQPASFKDQSVTYDGQMHKLEVSATEVPEGTKVSYLYKGVTNAAGVKEPGTYKVTAVFAPANDNYSLSGNTTYEALLTIMPSSGEQSSQQISESSQQQTTDPAQQTSATTAKQDPQQSVAQQEVARQAAIEEQKAKAAAAFRLNVADNQQNIPIQLKKKNTSVKVVSIGEGDSLAGAVSGNPSAVTASVSGSTIVLKGLKNKAKATITVTTKLGASVSFSVKVQKNKVATKSIKVAKKKLILKVKQKFDLAASVNPVTSSDKLTFSSSSKAVATVSGKGIVTAKKAGTATITVKAGSKKVKVKVKVSK